LSADTTGRLRLFFALWPAPEAARALHEWAVRAQRQTGGRVTRAETIHLTLAFLGELPAERLPRAVEAARTVRFARHELPIDEARYWPDKRIVWVGPRRTPAETVALADRLRLALAAAGFEIERRPFTAHVTLLRKATRRGELPALGTLAWPVEEFVLVRSRLSAQGADYEVLERFPAV
jgi:2'-5' RNA ligase